MSRKSRGINAERDLIHKFWDSGWAAMRAPASGSAQHPSPDILASDTQRTLAVECKLTTDDAKYFTKAEVEELRLFAARFGAEPWLAVKFFRTPWYFFTPETARETKSSFVVSKDHAKNFGIEFENLIEK